MLVDGSISFAALVSQVHQQGGSIIKENNWQDLIEQLTIKEKAIAIWQTVDESCQKIQGYIEDLDVQLFRTLQYHLDPTIIQYGFYAIPIENKTEEDFYA